MEEETTKISYVCTTHVTPVHWFETSDSTTLGVGANNFIAISITFSNSSLAGPKHGQAVALLNNSVVNPAGWSEWSNSSSLKLLFYAEYGPRGPGTNLYGRVTWSGFHAIENRKEAIQFSYGGDGLAVEAGPLGTLSLDGKEDYVSIDAAIAATLNNSNSRFNIHDHAKGSTLYGFKGGPAGIMKCKHVELTAEFIYPYRNRFKQAEETAQKLDLDGLVVIGGDDSNTNACLLAEYLCRRSLVTLAVKPSEIRWRLFSKSPEYSPENFGDSDI
ncbi:Pyrophosphate--fructose 6-phosphate 1-phosphotransferase subunit beta 1, partial [Cucurbita argyrosperma subsp. sororia]